MIGATLVGVGLSAVLTQAPAPSRAPNGLDSPFGGVEPALSCGEVATLRDHLKNLQNCRPEEKCRDKDGKEITPIDAVRRMLFGEEFYAPQFPDFMVYLATENGQSRVYGPVLSYRGKNTPNVFGASHVYVVVFSDSNGRFSAAMTTIRAKTITPIEALFQQLGKLPLLPAGGDKAAAPPADPAMKAIEMVALGSPGVACPAPTARPLYYGTARFAVESDTVLRINLQPLESVSKWELKRTTTDRTVTATLTRSANAGSTTLTKELSIPKAAGPLTDDLIARYAKLCDDSLPPRAALPEAGKGVRDPDATTPLAMAKFPIVGEPKEGADKTGKPTVKVSWKLEEKNETKTAQPTVTTTTEMTESRTQQVAATVPPSTPTPAPEPIVCRTTITPPDNSTEVRSLGGFVGNSEARWITVSVAFGGIPRAEKIAPSSTTQTEVVTQSIPHVEGGDATTNGKVTTTTTTKANETSRQSHLNAYVLGKIFLWRPRLKARESERWNQPYRWAPALVVGTNLGLDELLVGLSVSHVIDRVGFVVGVDFVPAGSTFPKARRHLFLGLDYSF